MLLNFVQRNKTKILKIRVMAELIVRNSAKYIQQKKFDMFISV